MLHERVVALGCCEVQLVLMGQIKVVDGKHNGMKVVWSFFKQVGNS